MADTRTDAKVTADPAAADAGADAADAGADAPAADVGADAADVSADAPAAAEPEPIELDAEEAELVGHDLDALLPTLDGARHERYARLREAVAAGQVPGELVPALESLLELTLQTARARARYRAEGEKVLTGLYGRTPGGRQLSAHLRAVNEALTSLEGQTIVSLSTRMRTVGHFTLTIQTDQTTLTLVSRPDTIDVESLSVSS